MIQRLKKKYFNILLPELLYLIGVLILHGMKSAGFGVLSVPVLSGFALLCLAAKIVLTDYSRRELFWISGITFLAIIDFIRNHNYTLLLMLIFVFAVKNVNLKRLFLLGAISRLIISGTMVCLALSGIIENVEHAGLPKYSAITETWEHMTIFSYGFGHPNHTFFALLSTFLLLVLAFEKRIKWYMYIILTVMLLWTYRYLLCRTGLYAWFIFLLLLLLDKIARTIKLEKYYRITLAIIPVLVFSAVFIVMILYAKENSFAIRVNNVLTGRIGLAQDCFPEIYKCLLGDNVGITIDVGYISFIYNYGWVLFSVLLFAYTKTMLLLAEEEKNIQLIVMAVMWIYWFMEFLIISPSSNLSIVLLARALYGHASCAEKKFDSDGIYRYNIRKGKKG